MEKYKFFFFSALICLGMLLQRSSSGQAATGHHITKTYALTINNKVKVTNSQNKQTRSL